MERIKSIRISSYVVEAFSAIIAVASALVVAAILIQVSGISGVEGIVGLAGSAFGSYQRISFTLTRTAPLLLAGLSVIVAFRSGVLNIGAEGQYILGGLFSVLVATSIPAMPGFLAIPIVIAAGFLGGAGWSSGTVMGFGNKLWLQWARASSVIYHEYSHNVIWDLYGKRFIGNDYDDNSEASAMDEGLADYFASSLLNNPLHGIEGYSGLYYRNLDNDMLYSDWGSEAHYNGMIISGALWHLRQSIGNRTADRLIFRSLQRTPHPDSFLELYFYLLIEDDNNNNIRDGTPNKENIDSAFKRHGIIKDS